MTKHELREQIDSEIAENERLISFWKEQAKLQADTELGSIAANMVRDLETVGAHLRKTRDELDA